MLKACIAARGGLESRIGISEDIPHLPEVFDAPPKIELECKIEVQENEIPDRIKAVFSGLPGSDEQVSYR